MWGEKALKELASKVLMYSKAEATQVSINTWESKLTRFANSYIHQNMSEENIFIKVRCVNEKSIGEASTNRPDTIEATVDKAQEISKISPKDENFPGFAEPKPIREIESFISATKEFTPQKMAKVCDSIVCRAQDLQVFGSLATDVLETCIANSNQLFVYNLGTAAFLNIMTIGNSGSGCAQMGSRDINKIDYESVAEKSITKAKLSQNPSKIECGKYEVIMEELAVADLLTYLAYFGFNALRYQEGRSPLCGKLGKKVVGENITIWDDGLDPIGFAFPFDFEGVPKTKVVLIKKGVAEGLVYDLATAKKEGKESTGHSTGSTSAGPMPFNLFMQGGSLTLNDMIKSTKKGILVTRLHYTNVIDPMTLTITGMTRDGTYLVENGEIIKPLKNLRFTQSIFEALSKVTEISQSILIANGEHYGIPFLYGSMVPAIKVEDWNFTGVTEH